MILIRILAETDAIWLPQRKWEGNIATNYYELRGDFRTAGIALPSGETDEAGRQRFSRAIRAMGQARRIIVHRARGEKVPSVRLTDATEFALRRQVGLLSISDTWQAMQEIAALSKPEKEQRVWQDRHVFEDLIAGTDKYDRMALEEALLPGLIRGYVVANSDIDGRVNYSLTTAGRKWHAGKPPPAEGLPPEDETLHPIYTRALIAAQAAILGRQPREPQDVGNVPAPRSPVDTPIR